MENDLISRSALKRFIQENGMVYANTLDKFPSVDAVNVVRCRDCKHFYDTHINPAHSCKRGGTQVWDVSFTPDDFCSYGERKADDEW